MKNVYGKVLTVTLFGESHGSSIGAVLDGLAPGIPVREEYIREKLAQRRPQDALSTGRKEQDPFVIESGVYRGYTTGTPLCIRIPNEDTHSSDYAALDGKARPGHSDYPAFCKYHGFEDRRGGGHFSGRITAALVALGAIVEEALQGKGVRLGTHLKACAGIADRNFGNIESDLRLLSRESFPVLSEEAGEKMKNAILQAKEEGDSVGGILETLVVGMPAGVGEPFFDTVEGLLSQGLFAIPAVKGVEFGEGFRLADLRGSESNDPYRVDKKGEIVTSTNRMGGISGGITNGMPLIFRCAVKPTPSIAKEQETVDFVKKENVSLVVGGRHDPCVAHRARAVVDAITALTLADLLSLRFGTDWLMP